MVSRFPVRRRRTIYGKWSLWQRRARPRRIGRREIYSLLLEYYYYYARASGPLQLRHFIGNLYAFNYYYCCCCTGCRTKFYVELENV